MNFSVYALDDIDDEQRSELLSKNWRLVTGGYWSQSPANHGYSAFFITKESAYMHNTIVIAVIILGKRRVKPSALFAKLFEVTPKNTATAKKRYELARLI